MIRRRRTPLATDTGRPDETGGAADFLPVAAGYRAGRRLSSALAAALFLLLFPIQGICQDAPSETAVPGSVTTSTLEAKIAEVEAAGSMEEQAKTKLVELYRKALSNLQTASSNAQATEDFRRAAETAPAEVQAIREQMEESSVAPPEDSLEVDDSTTLRQIEQLLQKEKADLAAVDARRADFDKRLEDEARRPSEIRRRLTEARTELDEVTVQLKLAPLGEEGQATADARRWALETRYEVLSTEIKMLDQELLSQPMRVDLLKAKRDKASASVQWVGKRVKVLEQIVSEKRREQAEQAKADAEETRREAEGKHPLVVQLAEQNAALSEEQAQIASRLDALGEQTESADKLARQIESDFKSARDTMEIGGLNEELGLMLRKQRQSLPDLRDYRRAARAREEEAAEIGVRRLHHREEEKRLRDPNTYAIELIAGAAAEDTPSLREEIQKFAGDRRDLLTKTIAIDDLYLRKLGELEAAQHRLLEAIEKYDAFLDEQLLWVRSASLLEMGDAGPPSEPLQRFLSLAGVQELGQVLAFQATRSPSLALFTAALALLLWGRRRVMEVVRALSDRLGKPTTDNFGYSLLAFGLTLISAAAWPMAMAVSGWQLKASAEATDLTTAVGAALLTLAPQLFHLRAFRLICMPDGLAAAHFRWPEASLRVLRAELDRLTWTFLPAALLAKASANLDPLNGGLIVGRVAFLIAVASLAFSLYRLLNPRRGILSGYLRGRDRRTVRQLYVIGYPVVVAYPLALGVLAAMGYLYTAGILITLFTVTAWFAVRLALISSLVRRWLLVSRRRLAYEAAMERRQAMSKDERAEAAPRIGEDGRPIEAEEPEVDLGNLSQRSIKLLNTVVFLYGVMGLWLIWSDVFPALRFLQDITLWHRAVLVDGVEEILPVTLANIGIALVYATITIILAKQLPAVLEIVLLQYTEMSAGGRYTFTTLTNYAIVTIGVVLVSQAVSADWSKLQWLVAALGVGIGFGLQEIVANFISGIIILFERPIRIGDVVTVGDTDGTVTRIQSRATTIRNWDGKELLVPNKEFITGRLLNWSLSDQTTRIILSIGIAYGSNVRQAMRLLEAAASENADVLDDPAPTVIFESFGDNSLGLLLRCFVDSVDLRFPTVSALNEAINEKFTAAGIAIAFPQRDLHLDTTSPLQVELRRADRDKRETGAGNPEGA